MGICVGGCVRGNDSVIMYRDGSVNTGGCGRSYIRGKSLMGKHISGHVIIAAHH